MNLTYDFIGPINDESILRLRDYIVSRIESIKCLTINISSFGGDAVSGATIYNYLKRQPFRVVTHNLGEVTSAAVLLYLAGATRTAESVSKFVIHPVRISGEEKMPYPRVEELLKTIDAEIKNYAEIVNRETNSLNGKYDIYDCLRAGSIILDAADAYECGIVTQMSE